MSGSEQAFRAVTEEARLEAIEHDLIACIDAMVTGWRKGTITSRQALAAIRGYLATEEP